MLTLFFMRHAQSLANEQKIVAGQLDYPLSSQGKADAELIAKEFSKNHEIEKIISSPLRRAMQTAKPFAEIYNLKIQTDDRIIEQNLGKYAGMAYEEIRLDKNYELNRDKRWYWIPEGGGESYRLMSKRLKQFLQSFVDVKDDLNILIVSHAIALRVLRALLEKTLPKCPELVSKNGEIWEIRYLGLNHRHHINSILIKDSFTLDY